MEFTKRVATEEMSISERKAGQYVIAELQYAFGQHRIQVWHEDNGMTYPDVIGHQF